jgi:predicted TIM-barrel fold metal-dependent hydrolase
VVSPTDVVRQNFYFCTIDDPSTIGLYELIGTDRIMLESDYPHGDSTWPDTQPMAAKLFAGLPDAVADAIAHGNAAKLFRHPLPAAR